VLPTMHVGNDLAKLSIIPRPRNRSSNPGETNMKAKHVMILLFIFMLFQGTLFTGTQLATSSSQQPVANTRIQSPVHTAGAGGENPLITNVIQGGGFETARSDGSPNDWYSYGTGYSRMNATYRALTHTGTYSGEVECLGTTQFRAWGSLLYSGYSSYPYLVKGLNMTLWARVVSNPDSANGGRAKVQVQTYNPYHSINYYLSYSSSYKPSNDSYSTYFLWNWSIGSWNRLSRNVTYDYMTRFGAPPSNCYVGYTGYSVDSPSNPTGLTEVLVDDYSLANRTSYNYVVNGGFESGDGSHWGQDVTSPTSVKLTTDHSEGSLAVNLTAKAAYGGSYGYAATEQGYNYPHGLYASQSGTGILTFDFKYADTHNGGGGQDAYVYIYAQNDTYQIEIYLYLGADLDQFSLSNSSNPSYTQLYIKASGFGNRLTWQHEALDLHTLFQQWNVSSFVITSWQFAVDISVQANSSVTLLVDNVAYLTYPTIDPGFEQNLTWSSGDPVPSWGKSNGAYPYMNRTSFAHSGKWAANITVYGGIIAGLYREQYVPIDASIYTDFWYQVKSSTSTGDDAAYIALYFLPGYYAVYYVLAGSSSCSVTNDSASVYYFVNGFNQTGIWKNLVRNVTADLAPFGPQVWSLAIVVVECYADVGGKMSVIYDDMNFVAHTHGPLITFAGLTGSAPTYHNQASVRVELEYLGSVATAVYYNSGSGWVRTLAANMGDYFLAHIPEASYGTVVHWYVNATDSLNYVTIDNNHGNYYSYTIGDDIAPVIDTITPINNTVVRGWSFVNVSAYDPGVGSSGISRVELWSGSTLLANSSSAPYKLHWNSALVANGNQTLTLKVVDVAGNAASASLRYDIENPASILTLVLGAGIAIVVVVALAFVCKTRRHK